MEIIQKPSLYGLSNSNRDFSKQKSWGKNIFNNAFPASLTCYFKEINLKPVYLTLDSNLDVSHGYLEVENIFGMNPHHENTFFSFESDFVPYRSLVVDTLPRADLVILDDKSGLCSTALEIKLTALPDNSTYQFSDDLFGCELVVRPDTVVYIALNIASQFKNNKLELQYYLNNLPNINDWTDIEEVSPNIAPVAKVLDEMLLNNLSLQRPMILQPIWKTEGRNLVLHENAFDVFVWSDFAFTRLFFRDRNKIKGKPTRGARTIMWLAKMLLDYSQNEKIDHKKVIDSMSFNTKNDKAFAVNGRVTQKYMNSDELERPRLKKEVLKEVILGGGEEYLSPERRLDAAILSTQGLFG